MTQMDLEGAETPRQCSSARILTGIKMSNLLHVREGQQREVASMFEATARSPAGSSIKEWPDLCFPIQGAEAEAFPFGGKGAEAFGFLWIQGHGASRRSCQAFGWKRISAIWTAGGDFPHEIGLLLGYPPEDVSGFIENGGKNFLCSGYWKVYKGRQEQEGSLTDTTGAREAAIRMAGNRIRIRTL